jgi:hypothetical protein
VNDLVERLRDLTTVLGRTRLTHRLIDEAAARIEALEAALRTAKEYTCDIHALRVINAALTPEQDK